MSEMSISREEAKDYLEFIRGRVNKLFVNAKEFELSIEQAISDMEKLEKIEEILNTANNDTRLDNGWDYMFKIEQTVKE